MIRATRREQLLVSCAGTVAARQRLHRILLLERERLSDAIRNDLMPKEARDESV